MVMVVLLLESAGPRSLVMRFIRTGLIRRRISTRVWTKKWLSDFCD